MFKAQWTDHIHEEWITALLRRGQYNRVVLERTRDLMDACVRDAKVSGYRENRLCGGEQPSIALQGRLSFLNRLCGGEHQLQTEITEKEFLNRLCGGEPDNLHMAAMKMFLNRLCGGE
ncbi:MAG: hypothetical protein PHU14_13170, partial [Methylovulum sp.]|nr:hypothetical protein [Methylovulum sp.]